MNKAPSPFGKVVSPILKGRKQELTGLKTGLDIGCAYGANSRYLASLGIEMDAIDKALPGDINADENINFQRMDVMDFPFNKAYDIILAMNVLQFLTPDNRVKVMDSIWRSLNQNGWLFINSFTADDEGVKRCLYESHFEAGELLDWAKEKGLVVKSYREKIINDNHKPCGRHRHGVVTLVGTKLAPTKTPAL